MKPSKKRLKEEIKRMKASFSQIKKDPKRKPNLTKCIKCKQDAGKNFIFAYKKNNELKGKICIACYKNQSSPTVHRTNHLLP